MNVFSPQRQQGPFALATSRWLGKSPTPVGRAGVGETIAQAMSLGLYFFGDKQLGDFVIAYPCLCRYDAYPCLCRYDGSFSKKDSGPDHLL